MSEILASYSAKFAYSFGLTLCFLIIYAALVFVFFQKIEDKKRYDQAKIRSRYVLTLLFMLFFIKIWVNGFIQIVAFIGFISAAITITQKDNLMNIIGWLIINWRELFHEGDYIKVANNIGVVKRIGFMYFTLQETSLDFPDHITGRLIKVPNGLVARNVIVNYSHDIFTENTVSYVFKPTGSFDILEKLFAEVKQQIAHYIEQVLKTQNETKTKPNSQDYIPKYMIRLRQERPAGYELVLLFYSRHQDRTIMLSDINKTVIDFTTRYPECIIAFD